MSKGEDTEGKETKKPKKSMFQRASLVLPSDISDICTYSLVFLFFYAAFGATLVYLPLYFKYVGLDAAQVGVLTGLRPFVQLIGAPIGGFLADKYKRRKMLTVIAVLAFVSKHLGILLVHNPTPNCLRISNVSGLAAANSTNATRLIPDFKGLQNWSSSDHSKKGNYRDYRHFNTKLDLAARLYGEARIRNVETRVEITNTDQKDEMTKAENWLNKMKHLQQQGQGKTPQFQIATRTRRHVESSETKTIKLKSLLTRNKSDINREFIIFLLIIVVCETFASPMLSLLDGAAVEYLGEDRNDYGKFRLWGSLGICIASVTVGAVIQQNFSIICGIQIEDYSLFIYFLLGFSFFGLLVLMNTKHVYAEDKSKLESQISKLKKIFSGKKNISFWATIVSLGIIDGFQMDFGPWFLDDLGTSSSMIGLATSLHFVINAFTYMISNRIINTLGYMNTLSLGLLLYAVVFIGFSVVQSSWAAMVLFSIVGFVASLTWSCGITYVAMVANPFGIVSTAEGLMNGIYTGIGIASGTVIGGAIIKVMDIRTAFRVDAAFAILVVVIFNAILWIDSKTKKHENSGYQPLKEQGSVDE